MEEESSSKPENKPRRKRKRRGKRRPSAGTNVQPSNRSDSNAAQEQPAASEKTGEVATSTNNRATQSATSYGMPSFPQRRRMYEFAADLRAINDGWQAGAPADLQAKIRNTFFEVMEAENSGPATQGKAALALMKIIRDFGESLKLQAELMVKSDQLNEVYGPHLPKEHSQEKYITDVFEKLIANLSSDMGRQELRIIRRVFEREGLVTPKKFRDM